MKQVIVYKQGSNWVINNNGYISNLPYWVKTKKQVREHLSDFDVVFA